MEGYSYRSVEIIDSGALNNAAGHDESITNLVSIIDGPIARLGIHL